MRLNGFALTFGTAILVGVAWAACAPGACAGARTPTVSPLEITDPSPAAPGGVVRLNATSDTVTAAEGEEPDLALPEYVLPAVEVRAFRTLSAPDFPLLAWTDTDTKGVHRHEADATSLRLALNFSWLNPFNW